MLDKRVKGIKTFSGDQENGVRQKYRRLTGFVDWKKNEVLFGTVYSNVCA